MPTEIDLDRGGEPAQAPRVRGVVVLHERGLAYEAVVPVNFCRIGRVVKVRSIFAHHFADVPVTKHAESITMLEEERIMAYYGAGTLYAEPSRMEPLL